MSERIYRMETVAVQQPSDWNNLIAQLPGAHALQTWQWGQVKVQVGWRPQPLLWRDGFMIPMAPIFTRGFLWVALLSLPCFSLSPPLRLPTSRREQ